MRLFYQPLISQGKLFLDIEESRHCIKVLRLKSGDFINVIDGSGICYHCQITDANPRQCAFVIQEKTHPVGKSYHIHIAIAPTKNQDRLEWFVEKAVEFGVDKISLIKCHQSERKVIKTDRLMRKAVGAMKQSLHFKQPEISELVQLDTFIKATVAKQKFIAYIDEKNPKHLKTEAKKAGNYLILIGPEGDFSPAEIEMAKAYDFEGVSLGKSRLRTETAGVAACHIFNLIND